MCSANTKPRTCLWFCVCVCMKTRQPIFWTCNPFWMITTTLLNAITWDNSPDFFWAWHSNYSERKICIAAQSGPFHLFFFSLAVFSTKNSHFTKWIENKELESSPLKFRYIHKRILCDFLCSVINSDHVIYASQSMIDDSLIFLLSVVSAAFLFRFFPFITSFSSIWRWFNVFVHNFSSFFTFQNVARFFSSCLALDTI